MALPINIEQLLTGRIAEWERLDFKKVPFDYRNRRIGDFLKELHLTEGRSTGFPKIRQALRQNGSPEPVFETDERNSYFLAHIDIHPAFKGVSQGVDGASDRREIVANLYHATFTSRVWDCITLFVDLAKRILSTAVHFQF